ncbi:hypothetical protein B0O99DRAFT_623354 [Bisporella sp. PMI_857]|nr:hypothetical protein B0O99DRAFT_623354 [Bisporella sp. PMI_857]
MATITCRVINAQTGKPAAGMQVLLRPLNDSRKIFSSSTDSNGQVKRWNLCSGQSLDHYLRTEVANSHSAWQIGYDTGRFFGPSNTSWPVMDVNFYLWSGGSFHMSILIGKYDFRVIRTLKPAFVPPKFSEFGCSSTSDNRVQKRSMPVASMNKRNRLTDVREHSTDNTEPGLEARKSIARRFGLDLLHLESWLINRRTRYDRVMPTTVLIASQGAYNELPAEPMEQGGVWPEPLQPMQVVANICEDQEEVFRSQSLQHQPHESELTPLLSHNTANPIIPGSTIESVQSVDKLREGGLDGVIERHRGYENRDQGRKPVEKSLRRSTRIAAHLHRRI